MSQETAAAIPHITLSGGTKLSRPLAPGVPLTIGQAKTATLRIPHPAVFPVHCTVTWEEGFVRLSDGGSPLGTKVNDYPVTEDVALSDGDVITVGLFQFHFTWEAAATVPSGPPASRTEPAENSTGTAFAVPAPGLAPPLTVPAAPAPVAGAPSANFRGQAVEEIPVSGGLTFGTRPEADIRLDDPALSPVQAKIEAVASGFEVVDMGRTGSLANGKFFERHPLVIGDLLQFGESHFFFFDGFALRPVRDGLGCGLQAHGIDVSGGKARGLILQSASFDARPGQFVGIIGPSGAGKTTLLRALLGLKEISGGTILLDGQDLRTIASPSSFFGYVPQQEIVHLELTARQALHYSALLRLPRRTPRREMEKLITALTSRLGLQQHLDTRAGRLSGGQLKRLSVCVELLSRPPLLFLDEPTSGLDPESETELMQQLQELSYTGCTVICTTHLMENVYLTSSLEVVMAGRDSQGRPTPGRTVFRGKPRLARELFNVRTLSKLYHQLKEGTPEHWQRLYQEKTGQSLTDPPPLPPGPPREAVRARREKRRFSVPVLLARQWRILKSDWKNLFLLIGQPVLIAGLIAVAATGENPSDKKLFLAAIAVLWLGCGNAAPELVRERSIFRREQFVGLRASAYLLSKFLGLGCLTGLQALLIFIILKSAGDGLAGSAFWQMTGVLASASAATGLGLAVSAWARNTLQAVLLVPVIIIPQILFAGFVFPVKDWDEHAIPRIASRLFPSFAAQRVMDVSLVWGKSVKDASDYSTALNNLSTSLRPLSVLLNPARAVQIPVDESRIYVQPQEEGMEPFGIRNFDWDPSRKNVLTPRYLTETLRDDRPRVLKHARPALTGLASLGLWTLLTCGFALLMLRRKDGGE
ncbi:MAG: ATP-binding cassette domain-containing protein [Verrucomicrobiota bacterium]